MHETSGEVLEPIQQPDPDLVSCFNDLLLSSAFTPNSASIMTKWEILKKFWAKELPYLRGRFGSTGNDPAQPEFSGFGFVVEGLAHFSPRLPRNTDRGDVIGQLIASVLHEGGGGFIQLGGRLANSDFIWLENVGQRVTVRGIGEVKASYEAYKNRRWQVGRQENALRQLARNLEEGGASHDFFRKRKIIISEKIERLLIVPFGEGAKFKNDLPKEWKLVELEFSYDEAVFISKRIWPDFRRDVVFEAGQLAEFEGLIEKFSHRLKPTLDGLFQGFGKVPSRQISLFLLAARKLPRSVEEINWIENIVEDCYWLALQRCFDNPLLKKGDLSEEETRIYDRLLYDLTNSQDSLLFFIAFARYLAFEISEEICKSRQVRHFQSLHSFNFLEI